MKLKMTQIENKKVYEFGAKISCTTDLIIFPNKMG
jgi:hypothetical protein